MNSDESRRDAPDINDSASDPPGDERSLDLKRMEGEDLLDDDLLRPEPTGQSDREQSFTRRALLRAGWSIPLIIALETSLPTTVTAAFGSDFGSQFSSGFVSGFSSGGFSSNNGQT